MKHTIPLLAALLLGPLAGLHAAEPVSLSADHAAAVNHQRRIFFQYDPAADIQRKGGFGSDMDAVMSYVFDAASQPGSQLDAICIDVSNEGVAHYRSKILPPIQHPGLMQWREQGLDYFEELIKRGHTRGKEIWWGLRMNEVERGHLAVYDIKTFAEMKERNPVKAAHPEWLLRSWWWQGFWNYAVKEVRDYRLSIVREVAEQYDFDGVQLDFLRTTPHLPPGKQWENREHLTCFMRDVRTSLQSQAAKRGRPFLLAARVPDSIEGCHTDGLDIETWAREGLVDVLVLGTRTIRVDVASFRKAMAGAPVKLMPSFDCFHATDGYHGDQSLDLVRGVFGNYLHQDADGVGAFNGIIGSPEQAAKLGLTQTDTRDLQVFSTIGSLATMSDRARYYPIDRRGGYAHNEGYGSSNSNAPLPIELRNDQSPSTLTLPVWESVKSGTNARVRLVLFQHVETDEVAVRLNGTVLKQDLVDATWKDPRIFSPDPQPSTVSPGALVKNLAAQKLTRLEFIVPAEVLKRGDNSIVLSVGRKGPFVPSKYVKVEKVELHLN
ncbi:MAG: family 10 glycosylhydrolase [Verrucomicrobiota bacterium]